LPYFLAVLQFNIDPLGEQAASNNAGVTIISMSEFWPIGEVEAREGAISALHRKPPLKSP